MKTAASSPAGGKWEGEPFSIGNHPGDYNLQLLFHEINMVRDGGGRVYINVILYLVSENQSMLVVCEDDWRQRYNMMRLTSYCSAHVLRDLTQHSSLGSRLVLSYKND